MKKALIIMLMLCSVKICQAHNGGIRGAIYDKTTRQPLPGATVMIDSARGAFTDEFGIFSISSLAPKDYTVTISYLSYLPQTVTVTVKEDESTALSIYLEASKLSLSEVTISSETGNPLHINNISAVDVALRPINTSQDILRLVPGLFIAQHAGGGKAEQIFLRGFDIDHGTDIALSVDGMPVNMVSHAHGQGYSDLHFVIPETVGQVDFDKGPYYSNKGNFNTAGYADFATMRSLDRNMIKVEGGQFGTKRIVGLVNLLGDAQRERGTTAYVATELYGSDGYFESSQHFRRANMLLKVNSYLTDRKLITAQASVFQSSWDASGQVPVRAVESGLIGRFGAIDDTEGGETGRKNLSVKLTDRLAKGAVLSNQFYYTRYDFKLYSNFTFFLNDPVNGDQIRQQETRDMYGYNGTLRLPGELWGKRLQTELGVQVRNDDINGIELSHTRRRNEVLEYLKLGDINEQNAAIYAKETMMITDDLTISAGARLDYFHFEYIDELDSVYGRQDAHQALVSPNLNLYYDVTKGLQLYLKTGTGYHSNDTRVAVAQPVSATVPRAIGADLGTNMHLSDRVLLNVAFWSLYLEQEFVYVGDEAVVEPSGRTRREGIDVSVRAQVGRHLFADVDVNATHARALGEPEGEDRIPLAPTLTSIGGLSYQSNTGINGSLRYRLLGDRAANEDRSIIAEGYLLFDAVLNYTRERFEVGVSLQNILNREWKEAQFATESRLRNEAVPVEEIHFTPGTPRFLKAHVSMFF